MSIPPVQLQPGAYSINSVPLHDPPFVVDMAGDTVEDGLALALPKHDPAPNQVWNINYPYFGDSVGKATLQTRTWVNNQIVFAVVDSPDTLGTAIRGGSTEGGVTPIRAGWLFEPVDANRYKIYCLATDQTRRYWKIQVQPQLWPLQFILHSDPTTAHIFEFNYLGKF